MIVAIQLFGKIPYNCISSHGKTLLYLKRCTNSMSSLLAEDTRPALCPSSLPSNQIVVDCCVAGGCCIFIGICCCCGAGSATGCRTRSCAEGKSFFIDNWSRLSYAAGRRGSRALGMSGLGGELWRKHGRQGAFRAFLWSIVSSTSVRELFLALGGRIFNIELAVPF